MPVQPDDVDREAHSKGMHSVGGPDPETLLLLKTRPPQQTEKPSSLCAGEFDSGPNAGVPGVIPHVAKAHDVVSSRVGYRLCFLRR